MLRVAGELDAVNAGQLRDGGTQLAAAHPAAVTLELSGLRFRDAAGLDAFVELRAAAADSAGVRLVLRGSTARLRRLLQITDLTYLIDAGHAAHPTTPSSWRVKHLAQPPDDVRP